MNMKSPQTLRIVAIVVGIVIFIAILLVAFQLVGAKASDVEPRDVIVSNIDKNSVRLSWATGTETQAIIEYGTSPTSLNFFAPEASKTMNHTLDLTLLSPSTTYYFDISIGDKKYDNGGVPWTFTTKSAEASVVISPTIVTTVTPTVKAGQVTPIQRLRIDDGTATCNETNCEAIKTKFGKGCSTQDYFKCLRNLTPTPTP